MTGLTISHHRFIAFFLMAALGCGRGNNHTAPDAAQKKNTNQVITTIQWIDSLVDLGKIPMGDTVIIRFRFRNTGSRPLVVTKGLSSCSCTRMVAAENAIPPGGKGEIVAVYDTRKSIVGPVYKGLMITMNTHPSNRILRYKAEVTGHKSLSGIY